MNEPGATVLPDRRARAAPYERRAQPGRPIDVLERFAGAARAQPARLAVRTSEFGISAPKVRLRPDSLLR